jgi:iduronate 2-sulfatase
MRLVYTYAVLVLAANVHGIQPTEMPTNLPTFDPTNSPTIQPTSLPTFNPTDVPSIQPTTLPTFNPTIQPTNLPSFNPTDLPSIQPTFNPTFVPTNLPSFNPTDLPSIQPTFNPTFVPTNLPTLDPLSIFTIQPSNLPSMDPTNTPTKQPTNLPTLDPTLAPSNQPTNLPTHLPTPQPTNLPTFGPIVSSTIQPTIDPTLSPTSKPTHLPTFNPTFKPTTSPTILPTKLPTFLPTVSPTTSIPTTRPTRPPTLVPSKSPTLLPTFLPSKVPTIAPTLLPTILPTTIPSNNPTQLPTLLPTFQPTTLNPTFNPTPLPPLNVLLLMADDFKPMIKSYGGNIPATPNIDRIVSQGINFMQAYTQMSICGPSRASYLTSIRPDTTQVLGLGVNDLWNRVQQTRNQGQEMLVMPKFFKLNGYNTYGIGKVFHEAEINYFSDLDVWTEPMWTFKTDVLRPPVFTNPYQGSWIYNPDVEDTFFSDGQAAVLAANLITEKLTKITPGIPPVPWFLAVGLWKPHLPWACPKKYFDQSYPLQNIIPNHDLTTSGLSKVQFKVAKGDGCGEVNLYSAGPNVLGATTSSITQQQQGIQAYQATVMYMDIQIGIILDAIDSSPAAQHTIVVFLGDHGWHLGDHGLFGKHTNYEQANKSPFIIRPALRDSSYPRNSRAYAPVELLDLIPTLAELTSLSMPPGAFMPWQGISLVGVMRDPINGVGKRTAVSQYFRNQGSGRIWGYSIRTTRYRYTKWGKKWYELYDYLTDQWETISIKKKNKALLKLLAPEFAAKYTVGIYPPFDFSDAVNMRNLPPQIYP